MPGQVRLNLPPRLIESARAAQYANRAALDARVLDEKVEAKAVQRHAAIQRAQPLPDDRVGGVLEFGRRRDPRIRLPRRRIDGDVFTLEITYRYEYYCTITYEFVPGLSPPTHNQLLFGFDPQSVPQPLDGYAIMADWIFANISAGTPLVERVFPTFGAQFSVSPTADYSEHALITAGGKTYTRRSILVDEHQDATYASQNGRLFYFAEEIRSVWILNLEQRYSDPFYPLDVRVNAYELISDNPFSDGTWEFGSYTPVPMQLQPFLDVAVKRYAHTDMAESEEDRYLASLDTPAESTKQRLTLPAFSTLQNPEPLACTVRIGADSYSIVLPP